MKSIISNDKRCFLCGKTENLEQHHCIFGTANRSKADKDGLWVWLDHNCHQVVHTFNVKDKKLLQGLAQSQWEYKYGNREEFIKRYGKSYL